MDIQYLLLLQEFRCSINDAWTPFMEWISHFAVTYLLIVPTFIYWCVDKKKGLYILASFSLARAVNAVVKLTTCAYRPWIRDARVIPAGDAITEATGYSFPSGHTTTATCIYGGLTVSYGKDKKWVAVICLLLLATTAFSRNYLGVHTPQDVVVALCLCSLVLFAIQKLFVYLEEHPEKENIFLLAGVILGIVALLYITFKSYPMDYADGNLLVNPQKMMNDGYKDIGTLMAFCIARFFEKNFVKFEASGLTVKNVTVSVLGFIPYFGIKSLKEPLKALLGAHFGGMIAEMLLIFFIVAIWPFAIKLICKRGKEVQL